MIKGAKQKNCGLGIFNSHPKKSKLEKKILIKVIRNTKKCFMFFAVFCSFEDFDSKKGLKYTK